MAYNVNATWNTIIKKQVISSANVLIYDSNNNLIVDKRYISNYTYKGRNSWVCKTFPSYEIQFTILDWTNYPNKSDLVKGKLIGVKYQVESQITNDIRWYVVYDNKYDYQKDTMTISAHSILQELTSNASYPLGNDASDYVDDIRNNYVSFGLTIGQIDNDFTIDIIPSILTDAELLQNIAIGCMGGLYIKEKEINIVDYLNISQSIIFNEINMLSKVNRSISDISSVVNIAEYSNGAINEIANTTKYSIYSSANFPITYYLGENEKCSNVVVKTLGGTTITPISINYYNDCVVANISSSANTTYVMYVNGYKLNQETKQTENETTIACQMIENDTHRENVRAHTETYYEYNEVLDFSCRIDPQIEPLDLLYIESIKSFIYVEELTITFNGGFKGNIKGRLNPNVALKSPAVDSITYDGNGQFAFTIRNPNPFNVECKIVYSGGTIDAGTIAGNSAIYPSHYNYPELISSFDAKYIGDLDNNVYCYFEHDGDTSDNTIIIEGD